MSRAPKIGCRQSVFRFPTSAEVFVATRPVESHSESRFGLVALAPPPLQPTFGRHRSCSLYRPGGNFLMAGGGSLSSDGTLFVLSVTQSGGLFARRPVVPILFRFSWSGYLTGRRGCLPAPRSGGSEKPQLMAGAARKQHICREETSSPKCWRRGRRAESSNFGAAPKSVTTRCAWLPTSKGLRRLAERFVPPSPSQNSAEPIF